MGLRFHVNSISQAMVDAIVATCAVIAHPNEWTLAGKRQLFNIGENGRQSDTRAIVFGNQQSILARLAQPCIDCHRDHIDIPTDGWLSQRVVSPFS